tara:strand:- start:5676 stop:6443 length:768 start_codon:yes stop_codon:yes gene_type:complete
MENLPTGQAGKNSKYFKYAIGEIILVVIGILIALQINNWNENRKLQQKENAYLERLSENLSTDLIQIDLNIEFYLKVFDYGSTALHFAENETVQKKGSWEILVAFFHSSQIWPLELNSATIEELKSSGDLSLINNIPLRNQLSYYYGGGIGRYKNTVGINPPYRKMIRGLIPSTIQNYLWENCHSTEEDAQSFNDCDPFISEEKALKLIERYKNNASLIEELRYYMSSIKVGLTTIDEQKKACVNMLEEIKKMLN